MRFWVSHQGGLVDADDARVSVLDHGFTVADGVFETLKVADGAAFALTRHVDRLERSAAAMGLPAPDRAQVIAAVHETVEANAPVLGALGRLRITYTAGDAPLGSDRGETGPTLVVAVSAMKPWPESAAVITVPWPRNERSPLAGVKSTSYAENILALARAHEHGAGEALMPDTQGRLCEGTGSNVFLVLDGRLITPSLETGCLAGVTRDLVLEWSGAIEFDVPMSALADAEEVFITSSTRDVQPVHRVDSRSLAAPGPVTTAVREDFLRRAGADADP
ncbi:MAG: aminotransferase class IV [Candidatus Nanopelagicales bacterium]